MSLLSLALLVLLPVYALAVAIVWALVRPRTARDLATFLFVFLVLTAWLTVFLLFASGVDQPAGVESALKALENVLGGVR